MVAVVFIGEVPRVEVARVWREIAAIAFMS
jgi:hypothetical protein